MIQRDDKGHVSFGRWDYVIQALIVLGLVAFAIETLCHRVAEVARQIKSPRK